ncbi:hypothetical protein OG21DRAFT_1425571, partial [Imleria badia]
IPHIAQQCMSSENSPVLGGAIPALEILMINWKKLAENAPHCAPFVAVGLEWAWKYFMHMGETCTYIIAMFINPTIRLSWIKDHWSISEAEKA